MKPATYREQDGCWNCRHAFEDDPDPHDGGPRWFCTFNSPRPTMMMGAWMAWADQHEVAPYGICNDRQPKETEQ